MRRIAVGVLVGILLVASGCARRVEPGLTPVPEKLEPGSKLLRFNATTHARELAFHFVGSVEKREAGRQGYEYVVRSTVQIRPGAKPLPPGGIHLSGAVLTASAPAAGRSQGRRTLLEVAQRTNVSLGKAGETRALPDLHFDVPAEVVARSDRIMVVLTGDHLQVTMIPDLKGRQALK